MQTTKIKAIFQGQPGSLGFENGKEYILSLETHCSGKVVIHHERPGTLIGYQTCEYSNLRALLMNWKDLNHA